MPLPPRPNRSRPPLRLALLAIAGLAGLGACQRDDAAEADVAFVDRQGARRVVRARPGQVVLFGDVAGSVEALGARVLKRGGGGGLLLAEVPAGGEGDFIAAARALPGLFDAFPNQLLTSAERQGGPPAPQGPPTAWPASSSDVELLFVDDFMLLQPGSGKSHGGEVEAVGAAGLQGSGALVSESEVAAQDSQGIYEFIDAMEAAIRARQGSRALLINISRGPRRNKDDFDLSYKALAGRLWWLVRYARVSLDNVVVTKSAGNSNENMAATLLYLHETMPEIFGAAPRLLLVGGAGTDRDCAVDKRSANYAMPERDPGGQPLMLYAPNQQVPIPGTRPLYRDNGTSFAAPRVLNLIARQLLADPKLSLPDAVAAVVKRGPMLCPDTCLPHVSPCAKAAAGAFTAGLDCPGGAGSCTSNRATATIKFAVGDCVAEQGGAVTLGLTMAGMTGTDEASFDPESCQLVHPLVVPGCPRLGGSGTYDLLKRSCGGYSAACRTDCTLGAACTCTLQHD